ncbi:HigA family addiction module antitoxin [Longimicrobium sp.]|uniref:HigA family addiction module antitoxin n=1 Tax=Longimicrobium sp. TaxID=2029185 RepID=UPI003B3AFFA5
MDHIRLAVRIPDNRRPTHAGEMLLNLFLEPLGMSQTELAKRIGVSYVRVNELVNGKRGITPDTALRLGRLLNTGPEFWLNHQLRWDMWHALHAPAMAEIEKIEPMPKGRIYEEGEDDDHAEALAAD